MKYLSHLLILIFLSSCSSMAFWDNGEEEAEAKEPRSLIDIITFWDNGIDEVDLSEPKVLSDISNQEELVLNWEIALPSDRSAADFIPNFSGEGGNKLGAFLPAFIGNTIFIANANGAIGSFEQDSGNENWVVSISPLASGISAGFGILVVAGSQGELICLSQDDGSIIWSIDVGSEILAPAALDAKLVLGNGFTFLAKIAKKNPQTDLFDRSSTSVFKGPVF